MVRGTFIINTRLERARLTRRQRKPNEVMLSQKTAEFQVLSDQQVWGPQLDTTDDLDTCNKNLATIVMETAVPRQEKLSVATRQLREKRRQMKRGGIDVRHIEYTSICKAIRQRLKEEISNYNEKEQLKALKKQQRSQGHQKKAEPGQKQHCYP